MKSVIAIFVGSLMLLVIAGASLAGLNDGLVAYYPFNGNANDESGNNNNGTVNGATLTSDRSGNPNSAYLFNGGQYIEIPHSSTLNFGTGDITVSAWFKAPVGGIGTYGGIIGKELQVYPNPSIILRISDQRLLQFAVLDCGTPPCGYDINWTVLSTMRVDDDVFHHAAGVRNSTGYNLYLDGQLVANLVQSPKNADSNANLFIGSQAVRTGTGTAYLPFNGIIDDVRVYKRALSESEIQQLYHGVTCSSDILKFTSGTPAKAAEVNANFDTLNCQIQAMKAIICMDHPTASICQ